MSWLADCHSETIPSSQVSHYQQPSPSHRHCQIDTIWWCTCACVVWYSWQPSHMSRLSLASLLSDCLQLPVYVFPVYVFHVLTLLHFMLLSDFLLLVCVSCPSTQLPWHCQGSGYLLHPSKRNCFDDKHDCNNRQGDASQHHQPQLLQPQGSRQWRHPGSCGAAALPVFHTIAATTRPCPHWADLQSEGSSSV